MSVRMQSVSQTLCMIPHLECRQEFWSWRRGCDSSAIRRWTRNQDSAAVLGNPAPVAVTMTAAAAGAALGIALTITTDDALNYDRYRQCFRCALRADEELDVNKSVDQASLLQRTAQI